ncbi:putative Aminotransferase class I/classII domain-containing protein [Seiridium cardinale]|uniref:Aminotransferase class I/classII domain-containing protein n=1 Tax=Seiridium cardinale TaxID=138064 RepID=A0ABR2XS21_9PEZI
MRFKNTFGVSERALAAFKGGSAWALMEKVKLRPQFDPESEPDGIINLSGASNVLMKDWMDRFIEENTHKLPLQEMLSYGAVSGGPGLLKAMAAFFNRHFRPSSLLTKEHIIAANGVTSLIDLIAWTLCNPGEAIIYPTPTFYMLDYDITVRSDVKAVPVSCSHIHDQFVSSSVDALVAALEAAVDVQAKQGVRCRVLFVCNPANPQGRCYSRKTLSALARFCTRRDMHLVADEIYAMSQFRIPGHSAAELDEFSSVLSISDDGKLTTHANIHCLYGMSKDFNMGGLRMGFLVTRNKEVLAAACRVTWFTWITTFSASFVQNFVAQEEKVHEYLTLLRKRLAGAYEKTQSALVGYGIPFMKANAGLFIFIDLSRWIGCFGGEDSNGSLTIGSLSGNSQSHEMQLCEWLIDHGVFINAGEFAEFDQPGHFRLVFTECSTDVVILAISRIRKALDKLERENEIGLAKTKNLSYCIHLDT